jgi:hypothetical protein
MPYEFTGTLKKLGVVLEPEKLSKEDQDKLRDLMAKSHYGRALRPRRATRGVDDRHTA